MIKGKAKAKNLTVFNVIGIIYSDIEMANNIIIASFRTARLDVLRYLLPQERSTN